MRTWFDFYECCSRNSSRPELHIRVTVICILHEQLRLQLTFLSIGGIGPATADDNISLSISVVVTRNLEIQFIHRCGRFTGMFYFTIFFRISDVPLCFKQIGRRFQDFSYPYDICQALPISNLPVLVPPCFLLNARQATLCNPPRSREKRRLEDGFHAFSCAMNTLYLRNSSRGEGADMIRFQIS